MIENPKLEKESIIKDRRIFFLIGISKKKTIDTPIKDIANLFLTKRRK